MSDDVESSYFNHKQQGLTVKLETVEEAEDSSRSSCRLQHDIPRENVFSGAVSI